jgi:prophage regulatory protein
MNTASVRLLRRPAVEELVGLKRSALYKLIAAGQFPAPVPLSDGKCPPVAWVESEVLDFIQERVSKRDSAPKPGRA